MGGKAKILAEDLLEILCATQSDSQLPSPSLSPQRKFSLLGFGKVLLGGVGKGGRG